MTAIPRVMPIKGWSAAQSMSRKKTVEFVKGIEPRLNKDRPAKVEPNPRRNLPNALLNDKIAIPRSIEGRARPSKSRDMICVVKQVPMFDPRTIPMVRGKVKIPASTKPMVRIITKLLLCTKAVKNVEAIAPFRGVLVAFASIFFIKLVGITFKLPLNTYIPAKKSKKPNRKVKRETNMVVPHFNIFDIEADTKVVDNFVD